jgi:hypothetical protein
VSFETCRRDYASYDTSSGGVRSRAPAAFVSLLITTS